MDDTPNVDALFTRYQERLALQWIAGREGGSRILCSADHAPGESLVGHLNTIHPNRLQILGPLELDYIAGLSNSSRDEFLSQLFNAQPAALIIAERATASEGIPVELQNMAEKTLREDLYYLLNVMQEKLIKFFFNNNSYNLPSSMFLSYKI